MATNSSSRPPRPSSAARRRASARNASPPSSAFNSVAASPPCELCASSTTTAQRRVGSTPVPSAPRSSASRNNCRETKGNFWSVVTTMGTACSSASASCREPPSIFRTTPRLCSNW